MYVYIDMCVCIYNIKNVSNRFFSCYAKMHGWHPPKQVLFMD